MRNLRRIFRMAPAAACFTVLSCAAQFPFIASEMQSETLDLKALCEQRKIDLPEKKAADSLCATGAALLAKKKNEAAFCMYDRAGLQYRIALTKISITDKENRIAREEKALSKNREDVAAYQQVLQELKTMEQK